MLGFSEWSWSIAASLPPYDGRLDAGAVVGELEGDGKTPYQRGEHTYDDGLAKMPPARPLPWAALLHRMHASVSTASSQMLAFGRPAGVHPARDRLRRRSRIRRGAALVTFALAHRRERACAAGSPRCPHPRRSASAVHVVLSLCSSRWTEVDLGGPERDARVGDAQQNVELVRKLYEAAGRRDLETLEAVLSETVYEPSSVRGTPLVVSSRSGTDGKQSSPGA